MPSQKEVGAYRHLHYIDGIDETLVSSVLFRSWAGSLCCWEFTGVTVMALPEASVLQQSSLPSNFSQMFSEPWSRFRTKHSTVAHV